ncbi:MAG: hypothetical protein LBG72_06795, partial [Spirochaetaceae bacterium]|nr:hypothetical protein [Spirochaetaceae bacterium]
MSKTKRIAIAFVAMALAGTGLVPTAVFAQSNRSLSTAGRFHTDVDDFIGVQDWSGVLGGEEAKSFFAYTRLGQGTLNGNLELGLATRFGEALYLAAFYNGWFQADKATSSSSKQDDRTLYSETRSGKPLTLEALVGFGNLGIKLGYTEELYIGEGAPGSTPSGSPTPGTNLYLGNVTPYIDIGFGGVFSELKFALNFQRDEKVTGGGTAGQSIGADSSETDLPNILSEKKANGSLKNTGSYVEPQLYIDINVGSFEVENDLALRFYTNGAKDADGKAVSSIKGLAIWSDDKNASMDEKFYIDDTITPSYGLSGTVLDDKVGWKVKVLLPININFDTDKFSTLSGGTKTEGNEQSVFTFGLKPTVKAAVYWAPAKVIDVHAGVLATVFDWQASGTTIKPPAG